MNTQFGLFLEVALVMVIQTMAVTALIAWAVVEIVDRIQK